MTTEIFASGFGVVFLIFLIIIAILWFLLPFAVFGIKARMDEHNQAVLEELRAIRAVIAPRQAEEAKEEELTGDLDPHSDEDIARMAKHYGASPEYIKENIHFYARHFKQ